MDKDATDKLITSTLLISVASIVVTVVIIFVIWRAVSRQLGGLRGIPGAGFGGAGRGGAGTSEREQAAATLQQNGRKARAKIVQVRPTGMIVNHINIKCEVTFLLEPLDGGPRTQVSKEMLINQTQMPRIGDVWPAWIDQADPSVVAVGQPNGASPDQIPLFREFGIPHPLDPNPPAAAGTAPAPTPPGFSPPSAPGAGQPDRVAQLERLVALRDSGALSELEFAAEKARVLGN